MPEVFQPKAIQNLIEYTFKDENLLRSAFTHSSSSKGAAVPANEGLAFLGEAVCEMLIREQFYTRMGQAPFSRLNATEYTACASDILKKHGAGLKLTKYLILSDSAVALRDSKTTEEELFLALIAAIYKDGGMPALRAFLLPKLKLALAEESPELLNAERNTGRRPFAASAIQDEKREARAHSEARTVKSPAAALRNLLSPKKHKQTPPSAQTEAEAYQPQRSISQKRVDKAATRASDIKKRNELAFSDTITATPERTPFIRDALAPVSLSDSQRQKLGVTGKTAPTQNAQRTAAPENDNYKSTLQEYVQKNIRSSVVMLEYKNEKNLSGYITTEIRIFGKLIASERGSSKKEAEKNAARSAYLALTTEGNELYIWFNELRKNPYSVSVSNEPSDYVSKLNRAYQKKTHCPAAPISYKQVPSSSKKTFSYAVFIDGENVATGDGKTVKEAKQNAAKAALDALALND